MTEPASDELIAKLEDPNSVENLLPQTWHVEALIARIRQQDETIKRIMADREYVIGWNDGYDHALDAAARAMNPILRSIISRGEAHATILALKDPNRAAMKGGEA